MQRTSSVFAEVFFSRVPVPELDFGASCPPDSDVSSMLLTQPPPFEQFDTNPLRPQTSRT